MFARFLYLCIDVAHTVAKTTGKLDQNLVLPLVVLCVDLGLNLIIVNGEVTKFATDLLCVECRSVLAEILQELQPSWEWFSESIIDLFRLKIPERLEL